MEKFAVYQKQIVVQLQDKLNELVATRSGIYDSQVAILSECLSIQYSILQNTGEILDLIAERVPVQEQIVNRLQAEIDWTLVENYGIYGKEILELASVFRTQYTLLQTMKLSDGRL